MPTLTTSPWQAALDRFSGKTVVGSRLRSAEWAQAPLALREGALFSSTVEDVRTLDAMRSKLLDGLTQARPGGTGMDRSRFVADMRAFLGADEGDSGDLKDLTSRRRLELIWDHQAADAHGHAAHQASLDPDILDAYPAQRLLRIESRRVGRDWLERWGRAGASVGWAGASRREMVALKTSPIWAALSRFGRPWPPFDFGSGMGLEDVDRDEAEQLGLLPKGEDPAARLRGLREASATAARSWHEGLEASVKGLAEPARQRLVDAFGDDIALVEDRVLWTPQRLGELWRKWTGTSAPAPSAGDGHRLGVAPPRTLDVARRDLGVDLTGYRLEVRGPELRHIARTHGADGEREGGDQVSITEAEVRAIPQVWRAPERAEWAEGPPAKLQDATPEGWRSGRLRMVADLGGELYLGEYMADTENKVLRLGSMWKKRKEPGR